MNIFEIIFCILVFILGTSFASFAGVIAYRVPKGLSIVTPGSFCPNCHKAIKPYDNIPILSWIFLGGKCRSCKSIISAFSPIQEMLGGIGFLITYLKYGNSYQLLPLFIAFLLLIFLFLIIAAIDYESHDIYNITIVAFAIIAIFVVLYRVFVFESSIWSHIIGAIWGFGFLGAIKILSKIVLKKDALGSGDVYLVGIGGFMLGIFPVLISILIASLLGLIIETIKNKGSISNKEEIAFAPYILIGIGTMMIYGDTFMDFYWEVLLNAFI